MSRSDQSHIHIARLVLEADTALSIGTGNPDGVFDTALVRDANGLPAIPGSSLAGVLRHLWREEYGENSENAVFGYQQHDQGAASALSVSWGALLDSQGRPAEGLVFDQKRLQDPLYASVLQQIDAPVFRDRVRLGHKGAAADNAKFDRAVLPAGHRFAVELRLWATPEEADANWRKLLSLLSHPGLRLGGATRAGLGRIRLVDCHAGSFDLRDAEQRQAFLGLGRGLADTKDLKEAKPDTRNSEHWLSAELTLQARGLWRIGQGSAPLEPVTKPADLLPKTEEHIDWSSGRGERKPNLLLVPASSLKGALAHRMAFHARRLTGQWAETMPADRGAREARPEAIDDLLGQVKDKEGGHAGVLYIDDAWLPVEATTVTRLMHNAIDRFTGGVRNRMLFEEESLLGGQLTIRIALDTRGIRGDAETAKQALCLAMDDLCHGRLALGSRTTQGNGFFDGELRGNLQGWLQPVQTDQQNEQQEMA